jgi:uncharacterized protein YggE
MKYLLIMMFCITSGVALDYQTNSINVRGDVSIEIEPNEAKFDLGVTYTDSIADSAIVRVNAAIKQITPIFEKYGLDKNSAKLKNISISENYEWENKNKVFLDYKVRREYEIYLKDLTKLKAFLFDVHQAGANYIDHLYFGRSDYEEINKKLIDSAIVDAQVKGEIIANRVNKQIIGVDVISDEPPNQFSYQNRVDFDFPRFGESGKEQMLSGLLGGSSREATLKDFFNIEPGTLVLKKRIWVTFKII